MTIDDFMDTIFTQDEFAALDNIQANSVDIDELEKTGTVKIFKNEEDGFITETLNYKSFDGKFNFVKTNSYYKHNQSDFKDKQLKEQIQFAVTKEHYEKAAQLQKQLNSK